MGFDAGRLSDQVRVEVLNGIVAAIPEHMRPDVAADLPATVAGMVEERNQLRDGLVAASQKVADASAALGYKDALDDVFGAMTATVEVLQDPRERWVFLEGWINGRAGAK